MKTSLFPKFFRELKPADLAILLRDSGIDTVNAVIREGFWVDPALVRTELPAFVGAMAQEGVEVTHASADFDASYLMENLWLLDSFFRAKLKTFRLGYFKGEGWPRMALDRARGQLEALQPHLKQRGLRALLQPHHGTLISNPTAAYYLMRGLDSQALGVKLDPGNGAVEGYEDPNHAVPLLGDFLGAVGVKNLRWEGKQRHWCPLDQGVVDWAVQFQVLRQAHFDGLFVFMPFYHEAGHEALKAGLKRDVGIFKSQWTLLDGQ